MHRAVAGFSSTALDMAQLGQRQWGVGLTFTCKGCRKVEFLVRELAELREMFVGMKRTVTGHGLEEKEGETGDREVGLEEQKKCEGFLAPDNSLAEENWNGKENAGRSSSEDRDTDIEIEGEHGTEGEETGRQLMDGKEIRPGTQMLATHSYRKNLDGPVGNELDLNEGEALVYLMKHDDNEHWWLAED